MNQTGHELDYFFKLKMKTVNEKVKSKLRPCSYIHKLDQYYSQDNKYIKKINSFNTSIKDPRVIELKAKSQSQDLKALAF